MSSKKSLGKNKSKFAPDEQVFRSMFDGHAAVMLLIERHTGNILDANQSAVAFYGYSRSEICNMAINEIHLLQPEQVEAEHQRAFDEGRNYFIFPHRLASGEERTVEVQSSLITLQDKQVLFSIIHDITKRIQDEARFRSLFDDSPISLWEEDFSAVKRRLDELRAAGVVDFNTYFYEHPEVVVECIALVQVLDVNKATLNLYGFASKENLLNNLANSLPKEGNQYFREELVQIASGATHFEMEMIAQTWDKKMLTVNLNWAVIPGYEGDLSKVIVSIIDITERRQAENALANNEKRFRALIENGRDNISLLAADGTLLWESPSTIHTLGYALEQFVGHNLFELIHPDDKDTARNMLVQVTRKPGCSYEGVFRLLHGEGSWNWIEATVTNLLHEPSVQAIVINYRDITGRKQAEQALKEAHDRILLVFDSIPADVYVADIDTYEILFMNQHMRNSFGDNLIGKTCWRVFREGSEPCAHCTNVQLVDAHDNPTAGVTWEGQNPINRLWYTNYDRAIRWIDGKLARMQISVNITERKQAEDELLQAKQVLEDTHMKLEQAFSREQRLAHIDELTGINNRRSLVELAEREFNIALRYRPPLSIIMFDIDYFKQINDTFGHPMGDQVLKSVTQAVCTKLRSVDIIGRYGGDEFVILLPHTSAQEALHLAKRIHASITALHMEVEEKPIAITLSLGIAQTAHHCALENGYNPHHDSVEKLFQRADQALYSAKQAGRNRTIIFTEK